MDDNTSKLLDDLIFNTPEFQRALAQAPVEQRDTIVKNLRAFATDFCDKVITPIKTLQTPPQTPHSAT